MSDDEWIRNLRPPHIKRMLALHKREVAVLKAENARLRKALERIEVIGALDAPRSHDAIAAAKIARAALFQDNPTRDQGAGDQAKDAE